MSIQNQVRQLIPVPRAQIASRAKLNPIATRTDTPKLMRAHPCVKHVPRYRLPLAAILALF
jgi:hypothetical protein